MRSRRVLHAVESHTEGMPTRVITGGVGVLPGATMLERRQWFLDNSDDLRTLLMYEPRGHASMSGAILQPPTRSDADFGVLYIEVSGCLPMCGHGTIGVATVLVETGMVRAEDAETHPQRHILTAAMGTGREVAADFAQRALSVEPDDIFMLCTDGLWGLVTDPEILQAVQGQPAAESCRSLVAMALQRGGPDNVTVQLLRVGQPG